MKLQTTFYNKLIEEDRFLTVMSEAAVVHVGTPPAEFSSEDIQIVHFHDFLNLTRAKNEAIYSPEFYCAGHRWMLKVYPGGESESEDKMIAVYLIVCLHPRLLPVLRSKSRKEVDITWINQGENLVIMTPSQSM